ncbi:MAG: ABC transporter ATP-binding protein [Lentisphaerae bacterium]|nr:ABC transporter ATP-binding protein [Lentisphaerota bacterium]
MDAPVLEIASLRTHFRTPAGLARAVDGVSFSVDPGETYALVGESGCGKSVTALSVMRLVPVPAGFIAGGSVRLRGRELTALPPVAMRAIRGNDVSMIFQEPMTALNPVFTVGNQIDETLRVHRRLSRAERRRESVDMLRRVGIPDPAARYHEYPHQMSGGMRQRVMIAMALACRPALLIADEPTTALDVTIQSQILELIRELRRAFRTAVLLITHDMAVVSENADRVGVMYAGRVVEEAPRHALFAQPAHPYTRLLMQALPSRGEPGRPLTTIPGRVPPLTELPAGCRFHTRCPYVMERCRRDTPPPYAAGNGHTAECFLLDPSAPAVSVSEPAPAAAPAAVRPEPPRAAEPAPTLSVRSLTMHFPIRRGLLKRTVGAVRAVDGIDLTLASSETLALVGESGCGKTTVGKCIVRLLTPTAGSIRLLGQPVTGADRAALKPLRRRMQMIFQDPFSSLNPRRRIGEIIAEGMETHGIGSGPADRIGRIRELLPRVGLDPAMLARYPHEFSGGQRQRIGLARALALDPALIICDEATSSLDVSVQAQILNLLKRLQAELGPAYLFISHDLSVVRYIADRIAVMYLGRIVETGAAREIIAHPVHPYTRALIAAVPQIDGRGRQRLVLPGDVPSPANPPPGCRFHPRCPYAVDACRTLDPSLEPPRADPRRRVACLRKDALPLLTPGRATPA